MKLLPRFIQTGALLCALAGAVTGCALLIGCGPANGPSSSRSPRAQKWFDRAQNEFREADIDGAHRSTQRALDLVPQDEDVRLLAARVALARLEHDEVLRLLKGLTGAQVSSLRGRAYWYKGELEKAADALDELLADPDVDDGWAESITALARRGVGRKPFQVSTSEGRLATVQMARVPAVAPQYVVPLEIDGEQALALISTGHAEVMLDSASRREPSWVSLRFGRRLEVKDVPALTMDLSAISTRLGAPIKALLGSHLLRKLNTTLDFRGRQFVVRAFVPPPPPVASRVDVFYPRGGAMLLDSAFGGDDGARASLFVDTSMGHPVALDEGGWKKIGIEAKQLPLVDGAGGGELRAGTISLLQFGAFKLPQIAAVYGAPISRLERELEMDIDGAVGAGLLAGFRLTWSDGGRVLWVEQATELGPAPKIPSIPMLPPARGSVGPPGGSPTPSFLPKNGPFSPLPSGAPQPGALPKGGGF